MGVFWGNIAVKTIDRDRLKSYMEKNRHFASISPVSNEWVIVYDKDIEGGEQGADLAKNLSSSFGTTAIYFLIHDSDFLIYNLCFKGKDYDGYVSEAANFLTYFGLDKKLSSSEKIDFVEANRGQPELLVDLCVKRGGLFKLTIFPDKRQLVDKISKILERKYTFAEDRLRDLATILSLPSKYIDIGFEYLSRDGKDTYKEEFDNFIFIEGRNKKLAIQDEFILPKAEKTIIGSIYDKGNCLSFKLGKDSFGGALVVDRNDHHMSNSTVNLIAILLIDQKQKARLQDFKEAKVVQLVNCYVEEVKGKTDFEVVGNIKVNQKFNNSDYTYTTWGGVINIAKTAIKSGRKPKEEVELTVKQLMGS